MNQKVDIWKYISKGNSESCWLCTLKKGDARGHKLFDTCGRVLYAHRIVFELTNGYLPNPPHEVLHICGNPSCCNPNHLKEGTRSENVKQAYKDNPNLRKARQGSNNGRSKFTAEEILQIRLSTGTYESIAKLYNVNACTISRIKRGLRYVNNSKT